MFLYRLRHLSRTSGTSSIGLAGDVRDGAHWRRIRSFLKVIYGRPTYLRNSPTPHRAPLCRTRNWAPRNWDPQPTTKPPNRARHNSGGSAAGGVRRRASRPSPPALSSGDAAGAVDIRHRIGRFRLSSEDSGISRPRRPSVSEIGRWGGGDGVWFARPRNRASVGTDRDLPLATRPIRRPGATT